MKKVYSLQKTKVSSIKKTATEKSRDSISLNRDLGGLKDLQD
jgi:hypothetical protein